VVGRTSGRLFYVVFLPLAVALNLVLGVVVLSDLRPSGWLGSLELASGAFCCAAAGWLAASAWATSYWGRTMARQVTTWRQMADAIFVWLEDTPLPSDALQRLSQSLDEARVRPSSAAS
jgi:hypothetical protein